MFFQLAAAVPSSPLELVLTASAVTKAVLVVLALLSLASWAVMLSKRTTSGASSGRRRRS